MSEWRHVKEGDAVWYEHDTFGNVIKFEDGYYAVYPKMIKIGPFNSPEDAMASVSEPANRNTVDQVLDTLRDQIATLTKNVQEK